MKSQINKNIGWNILGSLTGKLLNPLLQLLVARFLLPEDYGIFSLALSVILFAEVFKDLGLTDAIIVSQEKINYIALQFTVQLTVSCLFYIILLLITPALSLYFAEADLIYILPLLGCLLLIRSVSDALTTYYLKNQLYQRLAIRQIMYPLVTGGISFILAYLDYGVYALVIGVLAGELSISFFLYKYCPQSINFYWQTKVFFKLFSLGKHIVIQRFSGFLILQADSFVIGKALTANALGLYRVGSQLTTLLPNAVVNQARQVIFTELSQNQEQDYANYHYYRFYTLAGLLLISYSISAYIFAPFVIPLVLGQAWVPLVPIIQVFSISVITGHLSMLNIDIAKLLHFSKIYSYSLLLRATITLLTLAWVVQYGLGIVIITWVIISMLDNVMNEIIFHINQKIIKLKREKILLYLFAWSWTIFVTYTVDFSIAL